jgi:formamidopyrimidine-DNA glycosylase
MPEYPDIVVYVEALRERIVGSRLSRLRIVHPFLLRTAEPRPEALAGKRVSGVERIGKQIVIALEEETFMVIHLMIAGRLRWFPESGKGPAKIPGKLGLAAFDFETGSLVFTEAGTKRRASLHLVAGREGLSPFDRGGLEVIGSTDEAFSAALARENHTLKRSLTDPRLFSGIGNSYSDEILHRARLSPFKLSSAMSAEETSRLRAAAEAVLVEWSERLRRELSGKFPEKVTAFRPEMAVHGRYGQPCPVCGTPVQRVEYAENECDYCPVCQTEGRLLADRALSRLLKGDWPRTIQELEALKAKNSTLGDPTDSPPPRAGP